jgi:choline dehydrogenase-like flavoprotein
MMAGIQLAGEIFLNGGAEAVLPGTFAYRECKSQDQLRDFVQAVRDPNELTFGTGHPMGGNCLSADPEIGVVDPEFRVHGYKNLHVCDASVFPTSLGVNPQLTVMALAHYAAGLIGKAP